MKCVKAARAVSARTWLLSFSFQQEEMTEISHPTQTTSSGIVSIKWEILQLPQSIERQSPNEYISPDLVNTLRGGRVESGLFGRRNQPNLWMYRNDGPQRYPRLAKQPRYCLSFKRVQINLPSAFSGVRVRKPRSWVGRKAQIYSRLDLSSPTLSRRKWTVLFKRPLSRAYTTQNREMLWSIGPPTFWRTWAFKNF